MSSYLLVALYGRCAVAEVEPFEDGIVAKTMFDFEPCFLHTPFFGESLLMLLSLIFKQLIIRKKVELHCRWLLCGGPFEDYVGGNGYAPHQ